MQSADFDEGDNLPNQNIEDTTPTFNVVRPMSYQKFVLVLDTSGSMQGVSIVFIDYGKLREKFVFIACARLPAHLVCVTSPAFLSIACLLLYITKVK